MCFSRNTWPKIINHIYIESLENADIYISLYIKFRNFTVFEMLGIQAVNTSGFKVTMSFCYLWNLNQ